MLSTQDTDTGTSMLSADWRRTPYAPQAVDILRVLNADSEFAGRIHLVSKCGPKIEERSRIWLTDTGFAEETGITPERWHFVRERADKAPVCERLGVSHFVDDRIAVLQHMSAVAHRYLFAPKRLKQIPKWATVVWDWRELGNHLGVQGSTADAQDG